MPRRLSAFMSGHRARAAGGLSCAVHWNSLEQCGIGFRAGEKRPGHARRPHSQARARDGSAGVGCARAEMTASARACSRVAARTASDDVAAAGDLPVPVAGCAVRANVVRKYGIPSLGDGIQGLGFEEQHDTSPAWARHRDPRAAHRQVNATAAQSTCSNCSSGQLFCGQNCSLWSFNLRRLFVQNSIQQ